jgi:outer membrane biosynthesis protein TonB
MRTVVAARLLRRVDPVLPRNFRTMLRGDTELALKLHIDARGEVAKAEPVGASTADLPLLFPHAIAAARQWRFEPAKVGGQPVPSEFVVTFRFLKSR